MSAAEPSHEDAVARLRALERVLAAVERLGEAGAISELIERAPAEVARALELERALLSRIEDGWLHAEAIHPREGSGDASELLERLRRGPVRLAYPLIEAEMLRRRRAQLISAAEDAPPSRHAFGEAMRWGAYVATPIVLEGRVIGFLHGDRRAPERPLGTLERDALWRFAHAFAQVFERAVLRRRLRVQRQELRAVAGWADARTSELSDSAIDLAVERDGAEADERARAEAVDSRLRELLTKRELEVVEQMVRGDTNAEIARSLTVSQETVKFHVKNILRKLGASNRAEATSRYLQLSLRRGNGSSLNPSSTHRRGA